MNKLRKRVLRDGREVPLAAPGGNFRADPTRCRNGHDLTLPGAVRTNDLGIERCLQCERAQKMRQAARRSQREAQGEPTAASKTRRRRERDATEKFAIEGQLRDAVLLESAPAWVRRGSKEEQDEWLQVERVRLLRMR